MPELAISSVRTFLTQPRASRLIVVRADTSEQGFSHIRCQLGGYVGAAAVRSRLTPAAA